MSRQELTAIDAVEAIVAARGNLHLASERTGLAHHELISMAAQEMPRLQKELKARTLIDAFSLVDVFKLSLVGRMSELEPGDVAKTYTTLIALLKDLTDDKTSNLNVNVQEYIWTQLPAGVKEAVLELRQREDLAALAPTSTQPYGQGEREQVIEGEWASP